MVYMKARSKPKNPKQIKKAAPVTQEEDDISSDEAPQLQKIPLTKGTKGRQSLSEKKVSFSIFGKNSPAAKTPRKDISILAKKQLTPANKGKTSMLEFKRMKRNKNRTQEEEDEDDEDDDFEMDDNMEEDFDLELDEGGDEDGEEDDGEEDEDGEEDDDGDEEEDEDSEEDGDEEGDDDEEDSDDDDEEEEENIIEKKLSMLKQKIDSSPLKENDKAKNAESPTKGQTSENEQPGKTVSVSGRMLYITGIPLECTIDQVGKYFKAAFRICLSTAPKLFRAAVIEFKSVEAAKEAYETNQEMVLFGHKLTVSYSKRGRCREEGDGGQSNHISRDRPSPTKRVGGVNKANPGSGGGKSGGRVCYKCNKEGHIFKDCPIGGVVCFRCKKEGHISRDCPRKSDGMVCFKCNEKGHISRNCPTGGSGGGGVKKSGGVVCIKCNEEGHFSRHCPVSGSGGVGKSGGVTCFRCKKEGHLSIDCPTGGSVDRKAIKRGACFICEEQGHMSRNCTKVVGKNADASGNPSKKRRFSKQEAESEE